MILIKDKQIEKIVMMMMAREKNEEKGSEGYKSKIIIMSLSVKVPE